MVGLFLQCVYLFLLSDSHNCLQHVTPFLEHLNKQHPRIKFTTENIEDSKIAFLDTLVKINEDKHIDITIYRKPTHTDQYLSFQSNHHIKQKLGIISTFNHRIVNSIQ